MGWRRPFSSLWKRTAPTTNREASTSSSNCFVKSGWYNTGSNITTWISCSRASIHSCVHSKGVFFFVRLCKGHAIPTKFLMKGLWYPNTLSVLLTCLTSFSCCGHSLIPAILKGSIRIPLAPTCHLRIFIWGSSNFVLDTFRKYNFFSIWSRNSCVILRWRAVPSGVLSVAIHQSSI